MRKYLALALTLLLHSQASLADDRLACRLPDGAQIVMTGRCEPLHGDESDVCDTAYQTSFVPAGGGAALDLGRTSLRRTEDSGTPAEMCANFFMRDDAYYLGTGKTDRYRVVNRSGPPALAIFAATPGHGGGIDQAIAARNLSYPGFARMAVVGELWVVEHALTSWHKGHDAGADFYRQPLSHVQQSTSADQGKSWSAPVLSTSARLFTIGRSALDQPLTAVPGAVSLVSKEAAKREPMAQVKRTSLRCRLPDRSELLLSGRVPDAGEAPFAPAEAISYIARPGAAPIPIPPDLTMVMVLPTTPGPDQARVCSAAGLANGVPYMGATMLDADGRRFTSLPFPDKIWFPSKLNRKAQAAMESKGLHYGLSVAVTRRGAVMALEYPLAPWDAPCRGVRGQEQGGACPVSAVLRSESRDQGLSWSDLAFSPTSWIYVVGAAPAQQPGVARLQRP